VNERERKRERENFAKQEREKNVQPVINFGNSILFCKNGFQKNLFLKKCFDRNSFDDDDKKLK